MRGVRVADAEGGTERLAGILRVITEDRREAQRLLYLATRDELTGHLNRTSLRAELAQVIEQAKAEERGCAYLVASIDRLAMINEAYGFGAADEVIVAVGERISATLRGSDIIGRTAGNKLGVILGKVHRARNRAGGRTHARGRAQRGDHARAPARFRPRSRWARCCCPRAPAPARKRCCAPKRRWIARAPPAATASPSTTNRHSARLRGCA